jgi:hypothetical protein
MGDYFYEPDGTKNNLEYIWYLSVYVIQGQTHKNPVKTSIFASVFSQIFY